MTLAGMLKAAGYATACVGKWKLYLPLKSKRGSGRESGKPSLPALHDLATDLGEKNIRPSSR